ncbi:hypothetical protein MPER_12283 [Moniliophthora perniciosa FA553]|nr:hypothetical protein MPER_12283 [Moniliophthora perniciosa FA553]
MLQSDIPIDLITGIIVLHAEKPTGTYHKWNIAFEECDEGAPTETGLDISSVPSDHDTLERRQADVEIAQKLTGCMGEIHGAIVHCMNMILTDLRRVKDLDPVWHKVGPITKSLVRDLGVLRRLVRPAAISRIL